MLEVDERYAASLAELRARSFAEGGFIANPFGGDDAARTGLRRTTLLLHALGQPDSHYQVAHIAGSKGKGSTAAFLAAILRAAGHKDGLHTSPHLHSYRERIAINGEPIDQRALSDAADVVFAAAQQIERSHPDIGRVNTFEVIFAMALCAFRDRRCAVAVIEVGLGGRLDATNVVHPAISVITALDLEHTRILGDSIEEIAHQKAGIIKPSIPIIVAQQTPAALDVIAAVARDCGSRLMVAGRDWTVSGDWRSATFSGPWGRLNDVRLGLIGWHQVDNAGLALAAAWQLREAGLHVAEAHLRAGLAAASLPGRFEVVAAERVAAFVPSLGPMPVVILDGAHTPAAAAALAATFETAYPGQLASVVLGLTADKSPIDVLARIASVARTILATAAGNVRAAPARDIVAAAREADLAAVDCGDVVSALRHAIASSGSHDPVIVTGSLVVVAEAREALGLGFRDE